MAYSIKSVKKKRNYKRYWSLSCWHGNKTLLKRKRKEPDMFPPPQAMFEVITSEATYLRSLDVLISHFMEDPGMNPGLPEGRRVLDKRQHHVIFSNVREVRDISAR